jgi:hypothetical protein
MRLFRERDAGMLRWEISKTDEFIESYCDKLINLGHLSTVIGNKEMIDAEP